MTLLTIILSAHPFKLIWLSHVTRVDASSPSLGRITKPIIPTSALREKREERREKREERREKREERREKRERKKPQKP